MSAREERRSDPLKTLSLFVVVGGILIGACVYAMGWVDFERTTDTTSIEIKTGEMKQAADDALQSGEKLMESASEARWRTRK